MISKETELCMPALIARWIGLGILIAVFWIIVVFAYRFTFNV
jgi:hypothetical protein